MRLKRGRSTHPPCALVGGSQPPDIHHSRDNSAHSSRHRIVEKARGRGGGGGRNGVRFEEAGKAVRVERVREGCIHARTPGQERCWFPLVLEFGAGWEVGNTGEGVYKSWQNTRAREMFVSMILGLHEYWKAVLGMAWVEGIGDTDRGCTYHGRIRGREKCSFPTLGFDEYWEAVADKGWVRGDRGHEQGGTQQNMSARAVFVSRSNQRAPHFNIIKLGICARGGGSASFLARGSRSIGRRCWICG